MRKLILITLIVASCNAADPSAQQVVDRAIDYAGVEVLKNANASFTFRLIDYEYRVNDGAFRYTRIQKDSSNNQVVDMLSNGGLVRTIGDDTVTLSTEKREAYTSSVNSVIYFAFLPFKLNDAAVNKSYEGQVRINDKSYHKVKISFDQKGGGEDFEDIFYYWFDVEDYSLDYLAYVYEEEEGTGMRFRAAYNNRRVNGVVIQDYKNLKPKIEGSVDLSQIDEAYQNGELTQLSLIELENVEIIALPR